MPDSVFVRNEKRISDFGQVHSFLRVIKQRRTGKSIFNFSNTEILQDCRRQSQRVHPLRVQRFRLFYERGVNQQRDAVRKKRFVTLVRAHQRNVRRFVKMRVIGRQDDD